MTPRILILSTPCSLQTQEVELQQQALRLLPFGCALCHPLWTGKSTFSRVQILSTPCSLQVQEPELQQQALRLLPFRLCSTRSGLESLHEGTLRILMFFAVELQPGFATALSTVLVPPALNYKRPPLGYTAHTVELPVLCRSRSPSFSNRLCDCCHFGCARATRSGLESPPSVGYTAHTVDAQFFADPGGRGNRLCDCFSAVLVPPALDWKVHLH